MGPLARRSPTRLMRSRGWGVLVAGALVLLCAAAAAAPIFAEASGNAALADELAAVPTNAAAGSMPAVRLMGGPGLLGRGDLTAALDGIDGLGPAAATAASIGVELASWTETFAPYVGANGRTERARLFGDDDVAHSLVPAPGAGRVVPAGGAPGLWLPAPLATALGVAAGDTVEVGVQHRDSRTSTTVEVAGVYAVDARGRRPADPPGSWRWTLRQRSLPADSEFGTTPAYLLVGDVTVAAAVARAVGDELLYAVEGQLSPPVPTLAQARATVDGIHRLEAQVRGPLLPGGVPDRLHEQVVSGLPQLVSAAAAVADQTVAWTSTFVAAGAALGLASILAVAALGTVRRAIELRHAVGVGLRPTMIGALAALEVLPIAVLAAAAGVGLAGLAVAAVGPPGAITTPSLLAGALRAGLAALGGLVIVGGTSTVAAVRAARLATRRGLARPRQWELLLGVVAMTAAVGLVGGPIRTGPPSALDLVVPLLVLAAAGAIGTRATLAGAATIVRRRPADALASGWSRRPARTLAGRRVATGGPQQVLVVTILATGLGLLTYSVAAATSISQVTRDRAAVRAGANATAEIEVSWLLDDGAAQLPPDDGASAPILGPVPGVRTPPLPAGTTIVWRARASVRADYRSLDLLVIDPARFAAVAAWGSGPELARAKALLPALRSADSTLSARQRDGGAGSIPAIGVGDLLERPGESSALSTGGGDLPVTFLDVVPAFPGHSGDLPLVVVPADSFFGSLGLADPRVRPAPAPGPVSRAPVQYYPSLWTTGGVGALRAVLAPRGMELGRTGTLAQASLDPGLVAAQRSRGLQVALGGCAAALAVLALAMFADRVATRSRAADLMLTRTGLGRGGVLRARSAELATLAALGIVLAGAGVALVVPLGARLLDPGGGAEPAFALRMSGAALAAAALAGLAGLAVSIAVAFSRSPGAAAADVLRDAD